MIMLLAVSLTVALGAIGWALMRPDSAAVAGSDPSSDAADGVPNGQPPATLDPTEQPSVAPTTPAVTPTPKPTPKKTTPKPRPRPAAKPPKAQLPPPPPNPVPPAGCVPKHPGPDASTPAVTSALASAGAKRYWAGVVPPTGAVSADLAGISVPADLMNAFAWTESSWRSTVVACDGGIGLMQVMPPNAAFLNQRFDFSPALDVSTVAGNTQLGAAYVEWLTVYFGLYYFGGSYDLMNASAPVGTGGATITLLDAVIAAYNVGYQGVEDDHGTASPADDTLSIPNPGYVGKVHSALANCPCTVPA